MIKIFWPDPNIFRVRENDSHTLPRLPVVVTRTPGLWRCWWGSVNFPALEAMWGLKLKESDSPRLPAGALPEQHMCWGLFLGSSLRLGNF